MIFFLVCDCVLLLKRSMFCQKYLDEFTSIICSRSAILTKTARGGQDGIRVTHMLCYVSPFNWCSCRERAEGQESCFKFLMDFSALRIK